MEGCWKEI